MQTVTTGRQRRFSAHDMARMLDADRLRVALDSQRTRRAYGASDLVASFDTREAAPWESWSHASDDNRQIRRAAKGTPRIHWEHASWASAQHFPHGKPLKRDQLARAFAALYGSTATFERFWLRLRAEQSPYHEARALWIALRKGGAFAPARRISEAELGSLVLDKDAQATLTEASAEKREQAARFAKQQSIFAEHRQRMQSHRLARHEKPSGHVRHCACHRCTTLDKAVASVYLALRAA